VASANPDAFVIRVRSNNAVWGIGPISLLGAEGQILGTSTYFTQDFYGIWSPFVPACDCCDDCGRNSCICPSIEVCRWGGIIAEPVNNGLVGAHVINGNALRNNTNAALDIDVLDLIAGTPIQANEIYGIQATIWAPQANTRQIYVEVNGVSSPMFHTDTTNPDRIFLPREAVHSLKYLVSSPFVTSANPAVFTMRIRSSNAVWGIGPISLLGSDGEPLGIAVYSSQDSNGVWERFESLVTCVCSMCPPTDDDPVDDEPTDDDPAQNIINIDDFNFDEIIDGDVTITSATIINSATLYTGNVTIAANVTINSPTVVVLGTVNVENSVRLSSNRNLIVGGDFRVQSRNADGTFGATAGSAFISDGSRLTVYGDFYTQSTNNNSIGIGNAANEAVLELHGNFNQIGTNTRFRTSEFFRIVFAGNGEQRIHTDRCDFDVSLGRIQVLNESQSVYFATPVHSVSLLNPTTFNGLNRRVEIHFLNTHGHALNVNGTLVLWTSTNLSGTFNVTNGLTFYGVSSNIQNMVVNGDVFIQNGGFLLINNTFIVNGDFRIQSRNIDSTFGATTGGVRISAGVKLTVYGDFYTQTTSNGEIGNGNATNEAVLELHGNFNQIGTNTRFRTFEFFRIVFASENEQQVRTDRRDIDVRLGRIQILNATQSVYFSTPVFSVALLHPTTFNALNGRVEIHQLAMNGHTLNATNLALFATAGVNGLRGTLNVADGLGFYGNSMVDSNLVVNGFVYVQGGQFRLNTGSSMTVNGDFRIQSRYSVGNFGSTFGSASLWNGTHLTVFGNFYAQSLSTARFSYGASNSVGDVVLELHGNFNQIGTDTRFQHNYEPSFRIIFASDDVQQIRTDRHDSNVIIGQIAAMSGEIHFETPTNRVIPLHDIMMSGNVHVHNLIVNDMVIYLPESATVGGINTNGAVIADGNLTLLNLTAVDGLIASDGDIAVNGNVTLRHSLLNTNRNMIINGQVSLNANENEDCILFVVGDTVVNFGGISINNSIFSSENFVVNTNGSFYINRWGGNGVLDVRNNLIVNNPIVFRTGEEMLVHIRSNLIHHKNANVTIGGLLTGPDFKIQSGSETYWLDLRERNCNNDSCVFRECSSHSFPTLWCGARLGCPRDDCSYYTNGATCNSCVTCSACSSCSQSRVFSNVYTLSNGNNSLDADYSEISAFSADITLDGFVSFEPMSLVLTKLAAGLLILFVGFCATGGVSYINYYGVDTDGEFSALMWSTVTTFAQAWAGAFVRPVPRISEWVRDRAVPRVIPDVDVDRPLPPPSRMYIIYVLYDKDRTVQYVGRTTLLRLPFRAAAHRANPSREHLSILPLLEVSSNCINEARRAEQAGIEFFNTLNPVSWFEVMLLALGLMATGESEYDAWKGAARLRQNNQRNEISPNDTEIYGGFEIYRPKFEMALALYQLNVRP
jgi:hypothetical protein